MGAVPGDGVTAQGVNGLAEFEGDAFCGPLVVSAHLLNPLHHLARCGGGLAVRCGGPVVQAELTMTAVPVVPLEAHALEMPISAASWAIGRDWHRSTSRLWPSTESSAWRGAHQIAARLLSRWPSSAGA
jgi:hypothetical protein